MNSKKLQLTVKGKSYEVEIGDLSESPITVTVNGKEYTVDYQVIQEAVSAESAVTSVAAAAPTAASPAAAVPADAGSNTVTAPLPGVIIEVLVKPGDSVKSGQEVCILEAMKMKNAIRAARDGIVAAVNVNAGQKVNYGDILVTLE